MYEMIENHEITAFMYGHDCFMLAFNGLLRWMDGRIAELDWIDGASWALLGWALETHRCMHERWDGLAYLEDAWVHVYVVYSQET
jgi:hypothetical protein